MKPCGIDNEMTGMDYQFAMYIAAIFMAGWAVILFWGWLKPHERKGLLFITAALLLASIMFEVLFFQNILQGSGFFIGIILRLMLMTKFSISYFYSRSHYV
jgi:inner membrane protein involved in colicin E2 resistance